MTAALFKDNKLTVVNVWGAFCGPCIEEMPQLAAWNEELPESVAIIGIVGDVNGMEDTEHLELAKKIVEKANVRFTNLVGGGDLQELLSGVIGYPTTFFVDSTGAVVGEPIVEADVEGYKNFVEEYLNE